MVIAYHAAFSAYGFWLPNEQRGSWSTEVWAPKLKRFGPATKTDARKSLAHRDYDHRLRAEMRGELKYPSVRFDLAQIQEIARGFSEAMKRFDIQLYACAIVWDHVHIVPARHRETVEFMARVMKSAATRQLTAEGIHPLAEYADPTGRAPTPWAEGGWERYLNSWGEIIEAVDYVNGNPRKHDLPDQHWDFVVPVPAHV